MISYNELLKKNNPFDYIALGFIMKVLGNVAGLFMHYHIADAIFGVFSWILIIKGIFLIPDKLRFPFTGLYSFLFKLYLLVCVVMIFRGYTNDYGYIWFTTIGAINYHLFQPTYLICYLVPFVTMIPIRYFNMRLLTNYSVLFCVITVVSSLFFWNDIYSNSINQILSGDMNKTITANVLSFYNAFAFVALFFKYIPQKKWRYNIVGCVVCVLLMVMGARRGGVALTGLMFSGALYFYTLGKDNGSRFLRQLVIVLVVLCVGYFVVTSAISSFLMERGLEDSRTYVEEAMASQMNDIEWIFGKGLNGRYYCPLYGDQDDYLNGWRFSMETGFYNLVLKGGYVMAVLYCLLLIIPAYKGWFKSNNLFCKAGAFFIVYHLISLKPFGILSFNPSFFFLWIMIVLCMNDGIRKLNDQEIKNKFFNYV